VVFSKLAKIGFIFYQMINFLIQVIQATFIQIISILGIFFLLGFILAEIQKATLKNYSRSIGWRGILWTAWIGTPVHEYGHAFFALLFRHKINNIVLFSPNPHTGELGQVNHSYNKKSFYQNAGNFFIGLAPLIFGPFLLVLLLYILVPQGKEIFNQLSVSQISFLSFISEIQNFLGSLFSKANLSSFSFWIFLYISLAIASHLAPSKQDLRVAGRGGLSILFALFLFNIFAWLAHWNLNGYIIDLTNFFIGLVTVYIYVLIISLVHFLLSFLILWPWRKKIR